MVAARSHDSIQTSTMQLEGKIAKVLYKSEETGYVVLSIETTGFHSHTAVGTMPDAEKGLPIVLSGDWFSHPKFGKQFKFTSYRVPKLQGEAGAVAYLSTLKGVKETTAKAIYARFGDEVFKVLDEQPQQLIQVKGIGPKTLPKIIESYQKTKGIRDLIAFLHDLGVSAGYAPRIYKEYREESIATIRNNPYLLADTVRGFGFKKSDEVARGLGIEGNSQLRIEAGVLHEIKTGANQGGHCYLSKDELCSKTCELLTLADYRPTTEDIEKAIAELTKTRTKEFRRLIEDTIDGEAVIYTWYTWKAECELADYIKDLAGAYSNPPDISDWLDAYEQRHNIKLGDSQREAVEVVAANKLVVMTGSAGSGKSATSRAIVQLWHRQNKRIVAVAPTGRAAQRIKEATGVQASTIHRVLGWTGQGFLHNGDYPIEGDAFLIDESSMMDLRLAHAFFKAIPRHAAVLLVGDVNQLPSVGPGNVLRDIIDSGVIPVVRLTQIFRQAGTSKIITCSQQINRGEFPDFETIGQSTDSPYSDALWLKASPEKIPQAIEWLVSQKLIELGWQQDQIQVLSAMHRGDIGNIALNQMMQRLWNPAAKGKNEIRGFREGDRVIQTSNNYDKGIFNGDIGKIDRINLEDKEVHVRFPDMDNPLGKVVTIDEGDVDDLMLANSISIHRSQGSEFPVVIMPASMSQFISLNRNLYYTGVTRAKKLLILVGEEKAIATAVRTQKISQRCTGLRTRLTK